MPSIDKKDRNLIRVQVNQFLDKGLFNEKQIIAHIIKNYAISGVSISNYLKQLMEGEVIEKDKEGVLKWV